MKLFVVSMRDRVSGVFHAPFLCRALGEAERLFKEVCQDPSTVYGKHAEDFDLFQHGTFDDGTGMYEVGVPAQIASGKVVVPARSDVSRVSPAVSLNGVA